MEQGYKSWQQWETTSIVMPALPWTGMQELATVGDHIYSNASFTMEQDSKSWQQWETTSIVMPALPWYRDARVGNSGRPHL